MIGTCNLQANQYNNNAPYNHSLALGHCVRNYANYSYVIGSNNFNCATSSVIMGDAITNNSTSAFLYSFGQFNIQCSSATFNTLVGYGNCALNSNTAAALGYYNCICHACSVMLGNCLVSKADCTTHVDGLYVKTTPTHADNAAALSAGLTGGQVYRTATGTLQIVY
jgi:hypothetical protein